MIEKRSSLAISRIITIWLALWLFIANVPTEASWPPYSHFLRLCAWAMVWSPLLMVGGMRLQRQAMLLALGAALYVVILNLIPFKFEAALMIGNMANALLVASGCSNTRNTARLIKALDMVLYTWASLLLIQILANLAGEAIVDFHSLFFPFSEARYYEAVGGLYRLTGPHIEPGTYCAWTYGLVLLRCFLGGRVLTPSTVLAMATLPLTLSVWGVIAAGAFAISAIMTSGSLRGLVRSAASLIVAIGTLLYLYNDRLLFIQEYLLRRSQLTDISGESKQWVYENFYANIYNYIFWGNNFTYSICPECSSPQDAGLLLNMIIYFGFPLSLAITILVLLAARRKAGWALVVFSLPLLFTKFFVWETIFCLVVFLSLQIMLRTPAATTIRRHSNIL